MLTPGDRLTILVCQCGTVACGYAAARCGQDRRKNVRSGCPVRRVTVQAVESPADLPPILKASA